MLLLMAGFPSMTECDSNVGTVFKLVSCGDLLHSYRSYGFHKQGKTSPLVFAPVSWVSLFSFSADMNHF